MFSMPYEDINRLKNEGLTYRPSMRAYIEVDSGRGAWRFDRVFDRGEQGRVGVIAWGATYKHIYTYNIGYIIR